MPDKKNTKNKYSRTNILKKFISRQFENTPKKKTKESIKQYQMDKINPQWSKIPKRICQKRYTINL